MMEEKMKRLSALYKERYGHEPEMVQRIEGSGSDRIYARLGGRGSDICIATAGSNVAENEAFFYVRDLLASGGVEVPEILAISSDRLCYLQSDCGNRSLYDLIKVNGGEWGEVEPLLLRAMEMAARAHYSVVGKCLDQSKFWPRKEMDHRGAMWDLNYFKYCFLKPSGIDFDEDRLEDEFEYLAQEVTSNPDATLLLRDYQSRNLMVDGDGRLSVIDFQGARMGDGLYDVASMVWQSRAGFPDSMKERMVEAYRREAERLRGGRPLENFDRRLETMVLFRQLQTLGAYGFRGLIEHKAAFLSVIPRAVAGLRDIAGRLDRKHFAVLGSVLDRIIEMPQWRMRHASDGLTVKVMSFSYKKGLPTDLSGNGGGFVFDCRGMDNPGRYAEYRLLTGRDRAVIDFLRDRGEIGPFLESCYDLVDRSVENYLQRGFSDLMVCFGCTGGQHRSVYSAEQMARHLFEKYHVAVDLIHREQSINERFERP